MQRILDDANKSTDLSKTILIADLHLSEQHPTLNKLFIEFISSIETAVAKKSYNLDNLYILGDFFNYWIGSDSIEAWHQPIITALNKLAKHTKIYFMPGNRDFLINQETCAIFNFELITTNFKIIEVYNHKCTILHGDTLCTNDKSYQRFRKLSRSAIIKILYLTLPLKIRRKLALGIKKQSNRHNKQYFNNPYIFDVSELAVKNLFNTTNTNIIIHGHTHRPKIHRYNYNNLEQYRYVVGDWDNNGAYYLEFSNNFNIELKYFNRKNP